LLSRDGARSDNNGHLVPAAGHTAVRLCIDLAHIDLPERENVDLGKIDGEIGKIRSRSIRSGCGRDRLAWLGAATVLAEVDAHAARVLPGLV
jgi:hypothetical protein